MNEADAFLQSLKQLDEDALLQTRKAVDDCIAFLKGEGREHLLEVQGEALLASKDIEREFLRRAKFKTAESNR